MSPGRQQVVTQTVLVVDDEPDILEVLQIALEHAGYRVLTAADGAEALVAVANQIPDAILLDVGMPNVDGWQVLEEIKASRAPEMSSVPVVMVTAWSSDEDQLRGGIEGAVRYLGKPFDPREVVDVIGGLLAEGAPAEPELRRRVQTASLERLARLERGDDSTEPAEADGPRVRLTRLDHRGHARPAAAPEDSFGGVPLPEFLGRLSSRQREVVDHLLDGASVVEVATRMGVSRSNIYAVVRRVAKRAGLPDGRAAIARLRRVGGNSRS